MKKILGAILTIIIIYTLSKSHLSLYNYVISVIELNSMETKLASSLIILSKLLKTLSFLGFFYYGFSNLLNINLNFSDKRWMYLLLFSISMFVLELISQSLPLKPIEGYESSFTFMDNIIDVITISFNVYIYQYISYGLFYGLFKMNK